MKNFTHPLLIIFIVLFCSWHNTSGHDSYDNALGTAKILVSATVEETTGTMNEIKQSILKRGSFNANDSLIKTADSIKVTTRGIIDITNRNCPAGARQLVGKTGYDLVPETDLECLWTFKDGVLTASPKWESVITRDLYRDFQMHVEFNINNAPDADPEKNGNSGIYIQQRYEIQILNSYGVSEADYKPSYCGSIYRYKKPDTLVCKPAGQWQSYDIVFRAARYNGDEKIENARITVYQNQQLIHDDVSMPGKTGAGKKEGPDPQPILLQGHHNQVRFRNIWIQELNLDRK